MHRRVGFAALYVTHDQDEAMRLADRVAVMDKGRIIDIGPPERIYREPNSLYVAKFVGSLNVLPAKLVGQVGDNCVAIEIFGRQVVIAASLELCADMPHSGDAVLVGLRPENVQLAGKSPGETEMLRARAEITQTMFLGAEMELLLSVEGQKIMARVAVEGRPSLGEEVEIWLGTDSLRAFPVTA
jgi:ABC-type Fe3+/spermidine/putrescine transport system ATPase subunit